MQKFLRTLTLVALLALPGVSWSQVAKVSEYDFAADTVAFNSIVGNGGTAWTAADVSNGYTTITMPFAMQYGQTSIGRGATLYVSANGYVTTGDATMTGIVIAPLSTPSGFTNVAANTIYTKVESNRVTVEWRKLKIGNNIYSFQLVLSNTGVIQFLYGPMTLSTTAQVFAGMQSSATDIYCIGTENNRWDTIVPSYASLSTTRTLSPTVHPYYDVDQSKGLRYTFTQPECAKPNSFGAVPGDFNVIFNWTGNGSKYQIKYNEGADFAPMTEGTLIDELTGSSYTLSNLPQRTTYYAYIRAYCATSGSWSAWRAVADNFFSTGCGYEPLPMTQDFTAIPECWDVLASADVDNTVYISGDYATMRAGNEDNGYANDVYAVLPRFNANLNNYEFDLTARVESTTYGTLTLGYLTNINNLSGFVALTEITGLTTSYRDIALYLTDYAAIPSGARLTLKWSNNYSYYDCYIDQIVIKPQPTCFPISNLMVSDVQPTSAKFSFTDGHSTSTAYQLVYGAPGFNPDDATPVTITNGGVVNGLEGSTHYNAYVRALCGSEQLEWVGPVDFSTPCPVSCVLAFEMEDSYGDGWNGAYISLYQNDELYNTYTVDASEASFQVTLCGGARYSMTWISGSYDSECSMTITHNGTVIYDGGAPSGTFASFRACPSCDDPSNITYNDQENTLTWTAGDATQWQVKYALADADAFTTSPVLTAASFSTASLQGSSHYVVYVRSICGANDTNDWMGPYDIFTPCATSCQLTLALTDSYGDGWNGASISLYQDGDFVISYTVASGNSSANFNMTLCGGSQYSLVWTTGSYDDECSMTITHNGSTVYSGGAPSGTFASFRACPACQDPSNIALNGNGAVAWTAGNTTQWQVRWALDGSSNYTYAYVSTPSYTHASWTPNTSYTMDVRSICGANDTLGWITYNFTMPCVAISLAENDYTENFDSYANYTTSYSAAGADVPQCWDLVPAIGVVDRAPHVGSQGAINGRGLVMTAGTSTCWPNNYAILPAFTQPVSQLQINFDYKTETATSNWLTIGYVTNASDTSTFVPLQVLPGVGSTVTPVEFTFAGHSIPAGARIALRWYRASSYYWINIDNVVVSMVPTCVKPNNLAASSITSDGATISWNEINSATSWRVKYGPAGFDPATEGTMLTATGSASATLSGLNSNTSYDVYVRSICEAGVDSSAWSNVYGFRTACSTIQSLPYAENFSGYTGLPSYPYYGPAVAPYCWNYYSNGTNTAATTSTSYYGSVGSYNGTSYGSMVSNDPYFCMPIYVISGSTTSSTYVNYNTQRGDTKYAVMPLFDQPLNNIMVSFDYKFSSSNTATTYNTALELGYITEDDVNTFVSLQTYTATSTTTQHIVDMSLATLAAAAPADARLTLKYSGTHNGTSTTSGGVVYCGIDNIRVKVIPNCFAPQVSTMTATNVTPTSATVSWVDQNTNTPTSWSVKYSSNANFDPATEGTATTVNTPTINLNGLESQTTYYVYVGVDCGSFGESEWSNAFTFTTPCTYFSMPFAENFGATLASDLCWSGATGVTAAEVFAGATLPIAAAGQGGWNFSTSQNGYTDGHYYNNIYGTSKKAWLITPAIDLTTASSAQLTFDIALTAYSGTKAAPATYTGDQKFMVIISADGGNTWLESNAIVWNQSGTGADHSFAELPYADYDNVTINLNNYLGNVIKIAFYAHSTVSGGDNDLHIDNILVDVVPPCAKPSSVHTTALAYNAATIDWTQNSTNATESGWEVMFGESPLDITTATVTTLTDHVFNATGLDEMTSYDIYVRANCGTDGYSDWSNVYTFTTPCAPIAVTKYDHYIYGFEDVAGTGATQPINGCWEKGTNYSTAYPYPSNTASYRSANTNPITPTNNYYLYMYGTTTYYSYAVLPEFSNPLNTLQLSLKAMRTSSTATYGVLQIGYMTDPSDVSTFVMVQQVQPDYVASPNYNWQTFTVYYDNVTAPAGARMAFMVPNAGTNYTYVDDIEVMPTPTCRIATNLTSENVYAKTADLSWTENSVATPAKWEVLYAPTSADLDNEGASVEVTGTPIHTLTNLIPETAYQWKVRAICVAGTNYDGDTADWSTVATFTTTATCVPPTLSAPVATANSVTLNWTENTRPVAATQWEVAVGETGFNQNIGGMHFTTSQNSSYVVEGLKHSTAYQVYVRSLCSDEDWSEWSNVASFNTSCAPWQYADMPLVQTFSATGLPNCWTKIAGTANVSSGKVNIYSANSMLALPEMGFAIDTLEMTFEAANYSGTTERSFQVGYLTSLSDTTTFTAVQTITLNSADYSEYQISFADVNNAAAHYIAFRGLQTGTTWADFNVRNVQLKLRESIIYLPNNEDNNYCKVFYHADTVGHGETYAGNVNMVQTVYPGEAGKVLHLTGMMDCEYGYDYLTIYEGVGTTGTVLYTGTGYDANIDVQTHNYDWSTNGALTIVFTTDVDNSDVYEGFKLYAECICPPTAPNRDWVVDTNAAFTWVNGRTYTNNVTVADQPDKSWTEEFMEKNVGGCDSVYHTLQLTVHPTYTLTARQELCQRENYEFYGETFDATGVYTRTAQTIYGADSTTTLTLQVRPAPTAYIYVNNERTNGTIDAFCDGSDLVMTARATIEGSTFMWDDSSTAAIRTVNPHDSSNYTLIAYDPTYGCPSLPVTLDVTTTPSPVIAITVENEVICAGGSATLTVNDANNTGCTYLWSNGQTGTSITVSPAATTEYTVTATTPNASACTATASATITVNPLPEVTITPSAIELCRYDELTLTATEVEGYEYKWTNLNNETGHSVVFAPTASGIYNLTVTDANGCVNEFTSSNIVVRPAYNINDTMSLCAAMLPYEWANVTFDNVEGGDYDQTWTIGYGCDSTVHMHLDVTATGVVNSVATYCEGAAFTFGQGQYQTSHVASLDTTMLSYVDTTSDVCPVQYNLLITVNPVKATTFDADNCDSYTWNDQVYTASGIYEQTLQTGVGCDSVVTMNLTIRTSTEGVDEQTVCDKLVWIDGQTYTENNTTAQFTIENTVGCDSIVTLNLTVNYANTGVDDTLWCATPTYTWINGQEYDMNETDGTVRYLLTDKNQYGCDSTQILNLVFNLPADTLAWADTTACDIWILDTVACDGSLVECQISQSGAYELKTPIANGRYVVSRYNVTINTSEYHTTVKRNVCLPYTWLDANDNPITVINDIFTSSDTTISLTFDEAENGCSRTEVLRLISTKPQTYNYVDTAICLGEEFNAYGMTLTPVVAGAETYSLPTGIANEFGCDSTVKLTLTVYPTAEDEIFPVLCEKVFEFNEGDNLYHYTYVNEENSEETVELTYASALDGQPYNGTTVANWATENGCQRTVTVNWTVNPTTNSIIDTTVAYAFTWDLSGVTYDAEGTYTDNVTVGENQYGCDSTVTLMLTLHDTVYTTIDTFVCTSYKGPDGKTYRENMSFTETLDGASQYGTDSVIITNFFVNQNPLTDVYVASSDPYTWIDGVEYAANTEAFYTTSDVKGCDSTLHLFFTKLDTIVLCSAALPYETNYGFVIDLGATSNTYQNNDVMGNDTIVSYVINMPTHNVTEDYGCDSYTWDADSLTYTESGTYTYAYTNEFGCASVDTLKLTVYNNTSSSETVVACDTYTWTNNGNTVTKTESGTYYSNYLSTDNCPSVDTLYLTVNYNTNSGITAVACDSYEWNDSTYDATGDYTYEYTATNGCASVDTLHLTIGTAGTTTVTEDVCDSYTWEENGTTYTESTVDSVVYQSFAGCDSTIVLNLTVRHSTDSTVVASACDTYTWAQNGETYTVSGSYIDTIANAAGCDSVVTLDLTVIYNSNAVTVADECDTYTWVTTDTTEYNYTASGAYEHIYTSVNGCPSVDSLYLTIRTRSTYDTTIVNSEGFYVFHYVANDVTYDTMFSANTPTPFGPLVATITNAAGCDSVITFRFLVGTTGNKTEVVVACQEYTWPRNNVTYEFISEAERAANNNAIYKTSTGTYIYEAPIVTISNPNAVDSTFILNLILTERFEGTDSLNFLLSNETLTIGDSTFDFTAEKAAGFNGIVQREVHYTDPQSQYCDSVITYNIKLIYNYDTTTVAICADQTEYTWGSQTVATTTPGTQYDADSVGTDGWFYHLVINQAPVYASTFTHTACDSYTWIDSIEYTADNNTATYVYEYNGCDSIVTLNLTVNASTHNAFAPAAVCDEYTWTNNAWDTTVTASGVYTHAYVNADNCPSVDTLHVIINKNTPITLDTVVCDTYTWTAGDGLTYTTSGEHYYTRTDLNGCDAVDTLKLTVNVQTTGIDEVVACDSLLWIDSNTYYINNFTAQYTIENVAGCDSIVTLNLTINHATHNVTTVLNECDNYVWTTSGLNYEYDSTATYPLTILYEYVNNQSCQSVDTLKLTLHKSSAETFEVTACDTYTWENNGNTITKEESGTYTSNYFNTDGCPSTDMLYLTINHASVGNDEIVASTGYYLYNNVLYTADRAGGDYFDTTFTVASGLNAAGCDSTTMLHLLVGTQAIGMQNEVVCDHFTWINGVTYEYRENAPEGALYYDATNDAWVMARPRYTHPDMTSVDGFDTITVLNLTLTQVKYEEQNVRFLLSQGTCFLTADSAAGYSINFSDAEAGTLDTAFHFVPSSHYCDSVITYHITLVDNYTQIGTDDICATADTYVWDNTSTMGGHNQTFDLTELITDFDHVSTITLTDTAFKGDANNEWVYAKVLTVHPVVYATERRTACDSYTWNGTEFTESTTTATRFFPNGSSFGCDSTVTLNLTIKYNSNTAYDAVACDEYTWNLNNETYTTSGDYTRAYTATNGCPSVDTLHLTINYNSSSDTSVVACDSYEWNGTVYDTTGHYSFEYNTLEGCASVDSLFLTINYNSNSAETKVVCDSYEWTNNGNVETYTTSGTYFSEYTTAEGCPSVDTLYLTINKNDGEELTVTVCDTYTWAVNGVTYTESGEYTYDSTDANGCYALCTLNLTVGYTTNNAETVVACNSYDWNGTTYTTSGMKLYPYTNEDGCASVDTLYLTINTQTTYGLETVENCGPYTWIVGDSTIGVFENSIETSTTLVNPRTMCDSVVFLRLTVYEAPVAYESATVCADALPYMWRGIEFTAAGDTAINTVFTANCDSTIHFTLTVNPLINVNLTDAICLGMDYNANGFVIAASELTAGTHTFSHTEPSVLTGCDSTTTLTITVGDVIYNVPVEVAACDLYSWTAGDGQTYNYTESGTYNSAAYSNDMGCTSIDVLELTINNNSSKAYTEVACDTYTWHDIDYITTGDYTYEYTDTNNCASVDTLHLTVNINGNTAHTEVACDSYEWHDTTYTTSGDYIYYYSTPNGCASADTLHLTVNYNSNASFTETACDSYTWNGTTYTTSGDYTYSYNTLEGCASVDTLHLTVNYNTNNGETVVACDSYTWNGTAYTTSGTYYYNYNTTDGCASVDTLYLTINNNSSSDTVVVACDSYEWNGTTYTSTGIYTYGYNTTDGCASVDTLHLTVNYNSNASFTETACDSYTWNGTTYTTSGDYLYNYNTTDGCASTDTLHLTVNYNSSNGETVTACDSYTWNGNDYTISGTYYYSYNTEDGCASVDTLYLTVNYNSNRQRTIIACDEYTWNGETYYETGDYLFSYEATNGCPSVDTLHLTVNYNTSVSQTIVACDEYEWNGQTYTTSGMYVYDYVAANNCESSDTLILTINESVTSEFTADACNYYIWNNQAYTESGTYEQTFSADNGCDSVVTMYLTINTPVTATVVDTACGSYTWNGQTYTTSGSYTYQTTSVSGCDSTVTLNLTVNQPLNTTEMQTACASYTWNGQSYTTSGTYTASIVDVNGCDATATLYLTILQPANTTETMVACDSYIWNGQTYTTSGTYTNEFTDVNGCTATATLNLTINTGSTATDTATACGSYTWNGQTYTTSGSYVYQTTNAGGCDSTVTLYLTVNQPVNTTETVAACDSYTWNGQTYTASGTYTASITDVNGCGATATLNLTILQPANTTETMVACDSYTWNGQTYTTSGTYTNEFTDVNGCSATATLNLTVNASTTGTETATACGSYTWHGETYTTSGNYTYQTVNAAGCDSTVTLYLTIGTSLNTTETVTECDSYEWNGVVYTVSGTYTLNGTSVNGCDSTVTLILTINHSADTTIYMQGEGSIVWNGETFTESGVYVRTLTTVTGCDSVVTLNLAILPEGIPAPYLYNLMDVVLTINHNDEGMEDVHYIWYRWYRDGELVLEGPDKDSYSEEGHKLNGCYYLEVATDESMQYWVRSNEVCITNEGIDEVVEFSFTIAPNPVLRGSIVTVAAEAGATDLQGAEIRIFDVQGRMVLQQKNNGTIVADLPTGMYMVRLTLNDGRKAVRRLIVK